MTSRSRTDSRPGWKVLLVLLAVGPVCAHPSPVPRTAAVVGHAPPPGPLVVPLSLLPADIARTGLVASFVIPALERSLVSGVALVSKAAPLPIDASGVRDMLLAQAGLSPEVAKHLDLAAPITGAVVIAGQGRPPLSAFTFAGRSASDVAALFAALGRTIARRGVAIEIENSTGDRGWFLPQDKIVVLADSDEALVRAGSLAVEARRAAKDDIAITLYPEMIARAGGTDLQAALARLANELEERAAAGGGAHIGPQAARHLRDASDYLAGLATAEIALHLDAAVGATILARLHPKPGSKLEALTRKTTPAVVDPALPGDPEQHDAGLLVASAYEAELLEQVRFQSGKLPPSGGKPVAGARRLLDALTAGLSGKVSMAARAQRGFGATLLYPTRDAAAAAGISSALLAIDRGALLALLRTTGAGEADVKVRRMTKETVGKTRAIHATLDGPWSSARAGSKGVGALIGRGGLDVFAAVPDGRVVVTMGTGAKERMAALVSGKTAAPTPVLGEALSRVGVRSFFYFLDLRQLIALGDVFGGDSRLHALNAAVRTPLPIFGGVAGDGTGQALTLDLVLPASCFVGLGGLVQAAMMTAR